MLADFKLLAPLSAGLLVVTMLLFLRSIYAAAIPLMTSALSIVWTFGFMGLVGIPMNILSAMLPSLIIAIGSTEDTHLMVSYFQGLAKAKKEHRAFATRYMLKHMSIPLFLTVLTTGLGFGSNMLSGIGLIRDFAIASTFAIVANGIITVTLVPLVLRAIGPRATRLYTESGQVGLLPRITAGIFDFSKTASATPDPRYN